MFNLLMWVLTQFGWLVNLTNTALIKEAVSHTYRNCHTAIIHHIELLTIQSHLIQINSQINIRAYIYLVNQKNIRLTNEQLICLSLKSLVFILMNLEIRGTDLGMFISGDMNEIASTISQGRRKTCINTLQMTNKDLPLHQTLESALCISIFITSCLVLFSYLFS